MKHNKIACGHCQNPFDFSNSNLLVDKKQFKGMCKQCLETHLFTIHILEDVMQFDGTIGKSVMVDAIPLRPPREAQKPQVARNPLGESLLAQASDIKLRRSEEELENMSEETLVDLISVFDPDCPAEEDIE